MYRLSNVVGSVVIALLANTWVASAVAAPAPVIDLSSGSGVNTADPNSIEGRLARLERLLKNQTLVDMTLRLESMQQEMQRMFGELEVMTHDINKLKQRQRELYLDIDRRFQKLETQGMDTGAGISSGGITQGNTAPGSDTSPADGKPGETTAAEPVDEEQQQKIAYQNAFNMLRERKYDLAKSSFAEFLSKYPKSDYADNAQYWLGEVNYVQRNFDKALVEFNKVLTTYPESSKRADALLKMGLSHFELEHWDEARKAFNTIVKKHPNSSAARLAEKRLKDPKLRKN